jgi:hypothetical protein
MNRNLVFAAGAAVLALLCVGVGCGQHNRASGGSAASQAQSGKVSLSSTRKVEASDPVYQMTAYTLEVPSDWKYAGTIARGTGCHATGASLKYTAQTPDGLTAIVQMPGVSWSWSSSQQMQQIMAQSHCPGVDIDTAAGLLVNIVVPNLRPNGKIVEVLPLLPQGQAALADQLAKAREQNAAMARQYGQQPQKLTLEGARARVLSDRDGKPVEEMISAVIDCNESQMPGLMGQPASARRSCSSRGEVIVRAPKGQLDALLAQPQFQALSKTIQANPDWAARLSRDQQAAFQQAQASSNAQFQTMMRNSEAQHQQLLANGRAFQAQQAASTQRALANDRAQQAAIDESAHKTAMYSLDQQEFRNPNTGQVIQASNQYNHQWISSDGSTLIQTNDHTYDPNGQVYPVSQSWSELVPKN